MIKTISRYSIASAFFILGFPLLALATVTPSDLADKSFGNTCAFENGLDDLANILQNNLCSNSLLTKKETAQCSRMALTQYSLCRYASVLNNSKIFITTSAADDTQAVNNTSPSNYSSDTTTTKNNAEQASRHKIFNWF